MRRDTLWLNILSNNMNACWLHKQQQVQFKNKSEEFFPQLLRCEIWHDQTQYAGQDWLPHFTIKQKPDTSDNLYLPASTNKSGSAAHTFFLPLFILTLEHTQAETRWVQSLYLFGGLPRGDVAWGRKEKNTVSRPPTQIICGSLMKQQNSDTQTIMKPTKRMLL